MRLILFSILLTFAQLSSAQEYKNKRSYSKKTGRSAIENGAWLSRDRKKNSIAWKNANTYNLKQKEGYNKYASITQIRDFYTWLDQERRLIGHEVTWMGIASIAAGQFSKLDNGFNRFFIVRNKEVVQFGNTGSKQVFEFVFPILNKVYFSKEKIVGSEAEIWDKQYGLLEQCGVLDTLYSKLSDKAVKKLTKMAKAKGVYRLAIPKELRFIGDIKNCDARFNHGATTIKSYYLAEKNKK